MVGYALMKTKLFAAVFGFGLLIFAAGCIRTVTGEKAGGVPFMTDTLEGRYKEPPEAVFAAAKEVIRQDGVLNKEGVNYSATNQVQIVEGRVSQCSVWVRIVPLDTQVTSVAVETRNVDGAPDMNVAHQIEKEIALRLARQQ
jgi:hypothetical protein